MKIPNVKNWRWWGARLTEGFIALSLFYLSVNLIEYREAVKRDAVAPEEWYVLNEIFVPDHTVGTNPDMIYDHTILVDHRGFWVGEVQKVRPEGREGVFQNACSGSGVDDYEVNDVLPDETVDWEWFFGRPCNVPAGQYRIQLTRDMSKPGYPVKQMRGWSNTFTVSE